MKNNLKKILAFILFISINLLYLIHQTITIETMTRQAKIDRLEKAGKKVRIVYSSAHNGKVVIGNHSFDSVNKAHKFYYGY